MWRLLLLVEHLPDMLDFVLDLVENVDAEVGVEIAGNQFLVGRQLVHFRHFFDVDLADKAVQLGDHHDIAVGGFFAAVSEPVFGVNDHVFEIRGEIPFADDLHADFAAQFLDRFREIGRVGEYFRLPVGIGQYRHDAYVMNQSGQHGAVGIESRRFMGEHCADRRHVAAVRP